MKVKLLKKVRKRFDIIHFPKGFTAFGIRYEYNLFKLMDSTNEYYQRYAQLDINNTRTKQFCPDDEIFNSEKECVDYLKSEIILRLRSEGHTGVKDKKMQKSGKKVWYIK